MSGDILSNLVIEFLDFLKYKIQNKKLTFKELEELHSLLIDSLDPYSTIDDLAEYYHKDKARIRTEIARKMLSKPTRRVYYNFKDFSNIVPPTWKHQTSV